MDSSPPPSAHHLTGDPGGRRRASGTSGGGSRACSVLPALSSCVRQGLPPGVVAGTKVGGLALRPLGDGAGGWPLGCMPCGTAKPQPKVGSRYPEGRGPVEKGVGAWTGRTGAAGKAEEAGSRDTSGAGGTVGKGNLAEKRGSSCSKAGAEATGGNEGGVQGCGPCTLSGAGYWRRDGGTGGGGSLGLGSSRRRKSELRKVLGSKEPGQLLRACRRFCPGRWGKPEEAGGASGARTPLPKLESATGVKLGGPGKFEAMGVCGGR